MSESPTPPTLAAAGQGGTVRLVERAVVLLLLGVLRVLQPFAVAILFGAVIAIGTWPFRDAMVTRDLAAALLLVVLVLLVALPALAMAPGLAGQIRDGVALARHAPARLPDQPPAWLSGLPLVGDDADRLWPRIRVAQGDLKGLVEPYSHAIAGTVIGLGGAVAESLVPLLLALIVTTAFWMNGDRMAETLRDIALRLGGPVGVASVAAAGGAVKGVDWGIIGTGIVQGVLLGVGFAIAASRAP